MSLSPHDRSRLESELQVLPSQIWALADSCRGEALLLLSLLRALEQLHRKVREELFSPALPNTRQELSHLLRNIEETGGWPYIERMRLQEFLGTFLSEGEAENLKPIPEEWTVSSAGRTPQQPTPGS